MTILLIGCIGLALIAFIAILLYLIKDRLDDKMWLFLLIPMIGFGFIIFIGLVMIAEENNHKQKLEKIELEQRLGIEIEEQ